MNPELEARIDIDKLLQNAGWLVLDKNQFDITANGGNVIVREFTMQDGKPCDYLIFVNGKACGIIEAKKAGISLSGVENQSQNYALNLPNFVRRHGEANEPLRFVFETNANEIYFTDLQDKDARSRRIFAFFKPNFLLELLNQKNTLRNNLKNMPPLLMANPRKCQQEAVENLENSLFKANQKSLIIMATGSGKTYTACNFSYRLIKFAKAKRILFLVDRSNLARQTKAEFDEFRLPDENRKFSEVYITQHLQTNQIDKDAKVVITTIQRIYSMISGESEFDEANEDISAFSENYPKPQKIVTYNPNLPIEEFDFIVVDECHRSIYGEWRQILEYFDAFIIGLTATPSNLTLGFFNQNIISDYSLERSIIDGINVDCDIFIIKTDISEHGAKLEAGKIPAIDKRTRKQIYEELDQETPYDAKDLDRSVVSINQIRTIMECYKNSVFTELYPNREPNFVPKTLIFAKDDMHAENIVRITREVFAKGNDFCKKITYNIGNEKPEELIKAFRIDPNFRIAVTVDMIATGTDIKALEVLIFMRDVKSKNYYEQMKGRGVRTINENDLQSITPNATKKDKFYIIDAVGVTQSPKNLHAPLERKKGVSFEKLLNEIAVGKSDDESISTLAVRVANLQTKLDKEDEEKIINLCGKNLNQIANELLNTIDADFTNDKSEDEIQNAKDEALKPFYSPIFRQTLLEFAKKSKLYIDELSVDKVISVQNLQNPKELIKNFKEFIHANKDEITALSIIFSQSYKTRFLTYELIKELETKLKSANLKFQTENLYNAFNATLPEKVKSKTPLKSLMDLIQIVKFAIGFTDELESFSSRANSMFELWKGRQIQKGINFSPAQLDFLNLIKEQIIANSYISSENLQENLSDKGGIFKAKSLFGEKLDEILIDLYSALVA